MKQTIHNRKSRKDYKKILNKNPKREKSFMEDGEIPYIEVWLQGKYKGLIAHNYIIQNLSHSNKSLSFLIMNSWIAQFIYSTKQPFHLMEHLLQADTTKEIIEWPMNN